jgi:glutamate carboxypeptidase
MLASPAQALDNPLFRRAETLVEPFLETTQKLAEIESPSLDAEGIGRMQDALSHEITTLGGEVRSVTATIGPGANIVGTWKGKGTGRILLVSHMDTVYPAGISKTFSWHRDGNRIFGPGVLDDKGGIAMGLMAVRLLRESGRDSYDTVTLLATTDEEKSSKGSKALIQEMARDHDVAFILEFGTPDDRIVLSRKGIGYFRISVEGKASHAGAEPEKGCNAIVEMANQLLRLRDIGRGGKDTSFNFTLLSGGERSNIIPAEAKAQADVRVLDPGEFDRLEHEAASLAASGKLLDCAKVQTSLERGRPPFPLNDATLALVKRSQEIYREIGRQLNTEASGAGTDGNYTAAAGTTTLDGLGPVGGGAHTAGDEHIDIDRIALRIYLLGRLIEEATPESAAR